MRACHGVALRWGSYSPGTRNSRGSRSRRAGTTNLHPVGVPIGLNRGGFGWGGADPRLKRAGLMRASGPYGADRSTGAASWVRPQRAGGRWESQRRRTDGMQRNEEGC